MSIDPKTSEAFAKELLDRLSPQIVGLTNEWLERSRKHLLESAEPAKLALSICVDASSLLFASLVANFVSIYYPEPEMEPRIMEKLLQGFCDNFSHQRTKYPNLTKGEFHATTAPESNDSDVLGQVLFPSTEGEIH